MSTRLGLGEFELKNDEVKRSTVDARSRFWQEVMNRKPETFYRLLQWLDFSKFPAHLMASGDEVAKLYWLSITTIFLKENIEEDSITYIRNTPLQQLVAFLHKRREKLALLEREIRTELDDWQQLHSKTREYAIRRLLADWKTLQSYPDAKGLEGALIAWAVAENLNVEWCLDLALYVLTKFGAIVVDQIFLKQPSDVDLAYVNWFERFVFDEVESCLDQVRLETEWSRKTPLDLDSISETTGEIPYFEFDHKRFSLNDRWNPFSETRKEFEDKMRKRFIVVKDDMAAREIPVIKGTKTEFAVQLKEYCITVVKLLQPNVVKTPRKNRGTEPRHFEWFVDFQVYPGKEYTEIARNSGVEVASVREAVQDLGNLINLSPRGALRSGRPPKADDK